MKIRLSRLIRPAVLTLCLALTGCATWGHGQHSVWQAETGMPTGAIVGTGTVYGWGF